jgi:uncharacterized hydrophobic protein (TIGR00271 family)
MAKDPKDASINRSAKLKDARAATQQFWQRWGIKWGDMSPEERRALLEQLYLGSDADFRAYLNRFLWLLSFSVLIAAFGLHANSTAVVIGAMLVAPLMEPILALAVALVMGWTKRLWRSVLFIVLGCLVSIALAFVVSLVIPERIVVVDEIASRTRPTLLDLGVALGAGAAAAYALTRRASVAMPGVAVAVALVPPLTVVGLTLEEGRIAMAGGAFLLFATNLVAILFAAALVLLLVGVSPAKRREMAGRRIWTGLTASALGVAVIALALTLYSVQVFRLTFIRDAVLDSVRHWVQYAPQDVLRIAVDGDHIVVDLTGKSPPLGADTLAREIAQRVGHDVELKLRWTQRSEELIVGQFSGEIKEIIEKDVKDEQEIEIK